MAWAPPSPPLTWWRASASNFSSPSALARSALIARSFPSRRAWWRFAWAAAAATELACRLLIRPPSSSPPSTSPPAPAAPPSAAKDGRRAKVGCCASGLLGEPEAARPPTPPLPFPDPRRLGAPCKGGGRREARDGGGTGSASTCQVLVHAPSPPPSSTPRLPSHPPLLACRWCTRGPERCPATSCTAAPPPPSPFPAATDFRWPRRDPPAFVCRVTTRAWPFGEGEWL